MTTNAQSRKLSIFSIGGMLIKSIRELVMIAMIVGLIATNIASVTNALVHDAIYSLVSTVAHMAGAAATHRVLASSPSTRQAKAVASATQDLRAQRLAQEAKLQRLDADHKQLQTKHAELGRQHKLAVDARNAHVSRTKQMASSVKARLARGIARNTESLPAKVIPAVGISVTLGLTAWDIYDACKTIEDINSVLASAEQQPEDTSAICGVKPPSVSEVLASIRSGWKSSVEKTKTELSGMQGRLQTPEIRLPSKAEVLQVACPVVAMPGVCT